MTFELSIQCIAVNMIIGLLIRGGGRYLRLGGQRWWRVRKYAHARGVWGVLPPQIF